MIGNIIVNDELKLYINISENVTVIYKTNIYIINSGMQ